MLCDRFVIAMEAMLKASAGQFSALEGLTREGGQIVFVSSDKRKIENTAPNAKPVKLPSGNWYVNAAGGKVEFEIIIDSSRRHLGLPVGFVEELKRKTIFRDMEEIARKRRGACEAGFGGFVDARDSRAAGVIF